MIRRLWFDLPAALRLAEHALSRTAFDQNLPAAPTGPCLILSLDQRPQLISNGLPALRAGNRIDAVHIDTLGPEAKQPTEHEQPEPVGQVERVQPASHQLLPLAGVLLMKPLRDGFTARHCWLLIDVAGRDLAMHTREARDTDTIPDGVERYEATVTAGPLGPYPARVARGYRHNGAAIAWFDLHTCGRLAADTEAAGKGGPGGQPAVRVCGDRVWLVEPDGTGCHRLIPVPREAHGWYRISHPALPWTATPTVDDGPEAGLFESYGPDGESMRCIVCGAINEIQHQELPSMVGYGVDTHTTCGLCGSVETTDPMFGTHIHRAPWPPAGEGQR